MGIENNGYKDVRQTIINFGGREQRLSIGDILEQDPSYMLAKWERVYAKAKQTSIGVAIAGAGGVVIGVWTGALPLMAAGLAVSALSGYLVKHHSEGVKSAQLEGSILDQCRSVLHLLVRLENRGARTSDLVSLYDRIIRGALSQRLDAGDPEQLKAFFQREVEQSNVLAGLGGDTQARGIANTPAPTQQAIGANTRLGAVDVPALPQDSMAPTAVAEDNWWESEPADTATAPKPAHPVDHLIGDRLRTSLIVSVSGGGKDILLSNALRSFLSTHPGFKVIVMDCKDDPKEIGYYANLPGVRLHRLNVAISSDGEVVQWVDRCINEFLKLPERALLINNEGTLIRAKSKRYVAAIDGLVSSGDSREKYAWEAGQSAHIDDLKINGAARSRFRLIIIGLLTEQLQVDAVLKAQCVADAAKKPEVIEAQMRRSPVQRAWCDGLQWYPMPVLENYSGYNRDARAFVANNTVTPADARAQLESLYQRDVTSEPLPNVPDVPEAGKAASQNLEGAGSTEEVDFPRSDDWRKYFPEAPPEVEEVIFRAYFSALEAGKRKQDFIADFLQGGTGGRRYQAAAKYLDYLEAKYKS